MLAHQDDLWRALVLDAFRGDFQFVRGWKEAYLQRWARGRVTVCLPVLRGIALQDSMGKFEGFLLKVWITRFPTHSSTHFATGAGPRCLLPLLSGGEGRRQSVNTVPHQKTEHFWSVLLLAGCAATVPQSRKQEAAEQRGKGVVVWHPGHTPPHPAFASGPQEGFLYVRMFAGSKRRTPASTPFITFTAFILWPVSPGPGPERGEGRPSLTAHRALKCSVVGWGVQ